MCTSSIQPTVGTTTSNVNQIETQNSTPGVQTSSPSAGQPSQISENTFSQQANPYSPTTNPVRSDVPEDTIPVLKEYFQLPMANESSSPELLPQIPYGSVSINHPNILPPLSDEVYIPARIPTSERALMLSQAQGANVFSPEWNAEVQNAAQLNGGLGNSEEGFLAWSQSNGFIRLRNPNLTPEQNRKIAEMSLTGGMPVEEMPSKTWHKSFEDPGTDRWVNNFLGSYEKELHGFLSDPTGDAFEVKDGKHRFVMKMNPETGGVQSYHELKVSGFKKFMQKNMSWMSPVINVAGAVFAPITGGLSMVAATVLDTAAKYGAYGKAALKNVGSIVGSALAPYTAGLSTIVGSAIDTGKVAWSQVVNAGASYFGADVKLDGLTQAAVGAGTDALGQALDTGKVDGESILQGMVFRELNRVGEKKEVKQELSEKK